MIFKLHQIITHITLSASGFASLNQTLRELGFKIYQPDKKLHAVLMMVENKYALLLGFGFLFLLFLMQYAVSSLRTPLV